MKQIFFILFFLFLRVYGFSQSFFQKIFGDTAVVELGYLVHQLPSGSIFFFGSGMEGTMNDAQLTMHKLDEQGNILWKMDYFDTHDEYPMAITYNNGVFVVAGETHGDNNNMDGFVYFIDTLGQLLAHHHFGSLTKNESFASISRTTDGGYICGGFATGRSGTGNDFLTVKFSATMAVEWQQVTGSARNDVGVKTLELPNGTFMTIGDQQQVANNYNVFIQCFTASGQLLWEKTVATPQNGGAKNAIVDSFGEIVIVGEFNTPTTTYFDVFLIKIKTNGAVVWAKYATSHTEGDAGFSVIEPSAGNYVVAGYGYNPIALNQDVILLSLDTSGTVIDTKYYGSPNTEIGYSVIPSVQGGFLVAGFTFVNGDVQYFLVHDALNLAVSTTEQFKENNDFYIFPNPLTVQTLSFNTSLPAATLHIFAENGQILLSAILPNDTKNYLLPQKLPSGRYFAVFEFENYSKTVQFIVF